MVKLQVQAQHLQKGDILRGSKEIISHVRTGGLDLPSNKVMVTTSHRSVLWGKYTKIWVDRDGQ